VRTWPVAGWLAAKAGSLFIRRGAGDSQLIRKQMTRHLEQQHPLLMFPKAPPPTAQPAHLSRALAGQRDRCGCVAATGGDPLSAHGEDLLAPFIGDDDLLSHLMRLFAHDQGDVEIHLLTPIACRAGTRGAGVPGAAGGAEGVVR
jgi:1-acyl-sn-glycerol-3-phosphate acyltransferase